MSPSNNLSYATPESLGIPSGAIHDFLGELGDKRLPMHSFMLLRHGQVAAEGYWPPFDEHRLQRMYSVSKSFTSAAVGMMIDEGKLKLTDRVSGFFPEYIPEDPHPYIMEATIEHLLTMATFNETTAYTCESPDFTAAFFQDAGSKHKPGAFFHYDTAATTTLCAIIEKLSGMPMLEYMRPALDEIGFSEEAWCVKTPEGRSWTGSGILCTARDLMRFALLCMSGGEWNGKQLISREYMAAATSRQIDVSVYRTAPGRAYGYGYQFWMLKEGGFGCFGMGSQLALCMPKYDAILITTADTQAIAGADEVIVDAFYKLLDKMDERPLPEDAAGQGELARAISALSIPLPEGEKSTPMAAGFSGQTYYFEENLFGFVWMRAEIDGERCTLHYENPTGVHALTLGTGQYVGQLFPEMYFGERIGVRDRRYEAIGGGAWTAPNALLGMVYAIGDYLGTLKMQLTFYEHELCVFMTKSAENFFDEYRGYLTGYTRRIDTVDACG